MKITQLRDKDKTTALTTMDMETWIFYLFILFIRTFVEFNNNKTDKQQ